MMIGALSPPPSSSGTPQSGVRRVGLMGKAPRGRVEKRFSLGEVLPGREVLSGELERPSWSEEGVGGTPSDLLAPCPGPPLS